MRRPRRRWSAAIVCSALALAALLPEVTFAQLSLLETTQDLYITMEPSYPGPNQSVFLTLRNPAGSLANSMIRWSTGGKTIAEGEGKDSAEIRTGALGSKTVVTATLSGERAIQASITIIPTSIDLLFEATSYVPPFFPGRPLPSPGTRLRLLAIPHFGSGGAEVASSKITFTWRQNGAVVASVSGKGKAAVSLPAPALFGTDVISVEARSQDGVYSGVASVRIPALDPSPTLYRDHPLFGIEYYKALETTTNVPEAEMTFAAVPYFADTASPNDPRLSYLWEINGTPVVASGTGASAITINANKSSGIARVSLTITSAFNVYLHAENSWNILFGTRAGIPGTVQEEPDDIFHSGFQ